MLSLPLNDVLRAHLRSFEELATQCPSMASVPLVMFRPDRVTLHASRVDDAQRTCHALYRFQPDEVQDESKASSWFSIHEYFGTCPWTDPWMGESVARRKQRLDWVVDGAEWGYTGDEEAVVRRWRTIVERHGREKRVPPNICDDIKG